MGLTQRRSSRRCSSRGPFLNQRRLSVLEPGVRAGQRVRAAGRASYSSSAWCGGAFGARFCVTFAAIDAVSG
jgi:hypothetical protein